MLPKISFLCLTSFTSQSQTHQLTSILTSTLDGNNASIHNARRQNIEKSIHAYHDSTMSSRFNFRFYGFRFKRSSRAAIIVFLSLFYLPFDLPQCSCSRTSTDMPIDNENPKHYVMTVVYMGKL